MNRVTTLSSHTLGRLPALAIRSSIHSHQSGPRPCRTSQSRASHIGRAPIKFPDEVSITTIPFKPVATTPLSLRECRTQAVVAGPLGRLAVPLLPYVSLKIARDDGAPKSTLSIGVENDRLRLQRCMWGTTRALLNNMVSGVLDGVAVPIRIVGVGYRALLVDAAAEEDPNAITSIPREPQNGPAKLQLALKLGFSHPIVLDIPDGISVTVPSPQRIILRGIDLQRVTQFASKIRAWRRPEPYKCVFLLPLSFALIPVMKK